MEVREAGRWRPPPEHLPSLIHLLNPSLLILYMSRRKGSGEPQEVDVSRIRKPRPEEEEMFAVVDLKVGGPHLKVICEDGKERLARIPGRFRRRMWIKVGDVVIVKLWEYEKNKCDVVHKYSPVEVEKLREKGYLKALEPYHGMVF